MVENNQSKGENENADDEKNNFLDLFSHLSFIIIIISSFLLLDCCHMVKDDQSKHEAEDEDDDKKTKWRKRFHTFLMRTIILSIYLGRKLSNNFDKDVRSMTK